MAIEIQAALAKEALLYADLHISILTVKISKQFRGTQKEIVGSICLPI